MPFYSKDSLLLARKVRKRLLYVEALEFRRVLHAPFNPILDLGTDHHVSAPDGFVSQWNDSSGNGLNVTASGSERPAIGLVNTPSNAAALSFDGVDDRLLRNLSAGLAQLPSGNSDRSMFLVAQFHDSAAWGGVSYGAGASNQAYGVGVAASGANEGRLFVQGWGANNDLVSNRLAYTPPAGPTAGWQVLTSVLSNGTATLYANGVQIASWTHDYDTNTNNATPLNGNSLSRFVIGEEIRELGHIRMDLAAVLVYDFAVTPSAQTTIQDYLTTEYLTPPQSGSTPNAVDDALSTSQNTVLAFSPDLLLANDDLGDPPTTITAIGPTSQQGGTVAFDNASQTYRYTPPNGFVGTDSFTYTITDVDSQSDSATVVITITGGTLAAPFSPIVELAADSGLTAVDGLVSEWSDQSGSGFSVASTGVNRPSVGQVQTPTGINAIRFDGVNDRLLQSAAGGGLAGLPAANENRSMFLLAQIHDASAWGGVAYGAGNSNRAFGLAVAASGTSEGRVVLQGWGSGNDLVTTKSVYTPPAGPTLGWQILTAIHENSTTRVFANGVQIGSWNHTYDTDLNNLALLNGQSFSRFVIGQEIRELGNIQMDVAAVLMYDFAANASVQSEIEAYLANRYLEQQSLNAIDDTLSAFKDQPNVFSTSTALANDNLGNTPTTITAFSTATTQGGTVVYNSAAATFTYNPPANFSGVDTLTYTLTDSSQNTDSATIAINVSDGFVDTAVFTLTGQPMAMTTLPDGRMLVLEKGGTIRIFNPADQVPVAAAYLTIPNVQSNQERGLTDITLDPNFESNGYFYVYYASSVTNRVRISRFTHNGANAPASSEVVIWEDPETFNLVDYCCHYGGGLDFGPDGTLYLTIGDKWQDAAVSQDLTRSGGKVIRINADGTIPADNPYVGNTLGFLPEVWAYGFRNPFRARWDLPTSRFFIADVGGNLQATAREEINLGVAGGNYGWNLVEGFTSDPNFVDPLFDYDHSEQIPSGGAVAGGLVYRGLQFPPEFHGAYLFGDYVGGWIRYLKFDANGNPIDANPTTAVVDAFQLLDTPIAPVAFEVGPQGDLFYADFFTRQIRRVSFTAGNQAPVITTATATPNTGTAPLQVAFSGDATDPEDQALIYTWNFGDGSAPATGKNVFHTYTASGSYTATLQVSDGTRTSVSEPIVVVVGVAPVINSMTPNDGAIFRAGENLTLSAVVTDDGPITGENYNWTVRFIHNAHTHPVITNQTGTTVPFIIPATGHDFSDSTGFEIELTITDATGIQATRIHRIFPEKVDITFGTNFPGVLTYLVDSIPRIGNFILDTAINFQHTLSVPAAVSHLGTHYTFQQWSNGVTSPSFLYTVPASNASLTAIYAQSNGSSLPITQNLVLRLDASAGVSKSTGDTVTGWADQSGRGNDLTAFGNPQMIANALNGHPVIRFDGNGDKAERTDALSGLPSGSADRSVFIVTKYDGFGYGGFTYGRPASNQLFGPIVMPNGRLMAQAWGVAFDFASTSIATGTGWMVQEVVLDQNQVSHFRNGTSIGTRSQTYNTYVGAGASIVVGAEIDSNPFVDMSVAEILVYDRALDGTERQQVQTYLQNKYFAAGGSAFSLQNTSNPLDVTDDGLVSGLDALSVINTINQKSTTKGLAEGEGDENSKRLFVDVNGDRVISASDVLLIINYLNNSASARSGSDGSQPEGEGRSNGTPEKKSLDDIFASYFNAEEDDERLDWLKF